MTDAIKGALLIGAVIGLLLSGAACEVMRWNECLRVHPFWYCAGEK